jgi:hypothetical protein
MNAGRKRVKEMYRLPDNFGKLRTAVVEEFTNMPAPGGSVDIVMNKLSRGLVEKTDCGCVNCVVEGGMIAETIVIIEEVLKMVSEDSETGICGLIYQLHERRLKQIRIIASSVAVDSRLTGGSLTVVNPDDLPEEVRVKLFDHIVKTLGDKEKEGKS